MSDSNSSDSRSPESHVHLQFDDPARWAYITEQRDSHGVTWKQMVEFGARYIEAVERVEEDEPEALLAYIAEQAPQSESHSRPNSR